MMCIDTLSLTLKGVPPVEPLFNSKNVGQVARRLVAKLPPRFAVNDPGHCT